MYTDKIKEAHEKDKESARNLYYETKGKIWAKAAQEEQELTKAYNEIMEQIEHAYIASLEHYQNADKR